MSINSVQPRPFSRRILRLVTCNFISFNPLPLLLPDRKVRQSAARGKGGPASKTTGIQPEFHAQRGREQGQTGELCQNTQAAKHAQWVGACPNVAKPQGDGGPCKGRCVSQHGGGGQRPCGREEQRLIGIVYVNSSVPCSRLSLNGLVKRGDTQLQSHILNQDVKHLHYQKGIGGANKTGFKVQLNGIAITI